MASWSGRAYDTDMSSDAVARSRKPIAEFIPFASFALAVLLAVLGQAVWLDGKIERLDTKLTGEIKRTEERLNTKFEALQEGQAAIRERLAGLESRVAGLDDRVAALENRVAGLEIRMAGLENRMAGLESRVDALPVRPSEPVS